MLLQGQRQEDLEDRRDDGRDLQLMLGDQGEERLRVKPAQQHGDARLRVVHPGERDEDPVGVRERQRSERAVDARHVGRFVGGVARVVEAPVGEHHALRATGGPAGVQQRRQLVVPPGHDRAGRRGLQ